MQLAVVTELQFH